MAHPGLDEALEALNALLWGAQRTVALDEILKGLDQSVAVSRYVDRDEER